MIKLMLEIKITDNTKITEIPIMPERFSTISAPVNYPIVDPSLNFISKIKNYS